MNDAKFDTDVYPKIRACKDILEGIAKRPEIGSSVVLVENEGLYEKALYGIQRVIRKLPKNGGICLILDSHGGSIDVASSIAGLCRARFGSLKVVVPFMAKSAAALIALDADERILTFSAQLGPVDPQVRHPETRMMFPAHSIKEALEQVEETKDPLVKIAMADKLDPFLIGAYKDAISAAKQYIEVVVERWKVPNAEEIVSAFTDKYKSHGWPIDRNVLNALQVPYTAATEQVECLVCDLDEMCNDIIADSDDEEATIIMTSREYIFTTGSYRRAEVFGPAICDPPTEDVAPEATQAPAP